MKPVLQTLLVLALLALPWLGYAAPPATPAPKAPATAQRSGIDASVRAALALADAQRSRKPRPKPQPPTPDPNPFRNAGCGCDRTCSCDPKTCDCGLSARCSTRCECKGKEREEKAFTKAWNRAVLQNKPLLVWVRQVCPPCEAKLPECVHGRLTECELVSGRVTTDSCVIVTRPGQGQMDTLGVIRGLPDDLVERVRGLINPAPRITYYIEPSSPPMMMQMGIPCAGGS